MDISLHARFKEIEKGIWELPKTYRKDMRVPLRIIATEKLLKEIDDGAVEQGINVSTLPGIIEASLMMPDAHWGYGFPVGGVAAFSLEDGIISPGGIGFDINCGMRLLVTNLVDIEVRPRIKNIIDKLFDEVPSGVASGGKIVLKNSEIKEIALKGASWAIEKGMGWQEDINAIEELGRIEGADSQFVSERAFKRGMNQLGTLGSGNHYLEVQKVATIFDMDKAMKWGIKETGQITVMIHCGSRGFGHQVASDYLNIHEKAMVKYGIKVNDKQLACAPFKSDEGRNYFSAMAAAANFAFCNRQVITHSVRQVFSEVFGKSDKELGMKLIYDVAHNIAKIEEFEVVGGYKSKVVMHRKGATRAYPGQPVILGGSMETGSYLLVGTESAMHKSFGSTAHGSGRTMSRAKAKALVQGKSLQEKLKSQGIYIKSASYSGLAEEAGIAYKDINEIVTSLSLADISQPVVSFTPLGNIKG